MFTGRLGGGGKKRAHGGATIEVQPTFQPLMKGGKEGSAMQSSREAMNGRNTKPQLAGSLIVFIERALGVCRLKKKKSRCSWDASMG